VKQIRLKDEIKIVKKCRICPLISESDFLDLCCGLGAGDNLAGMLQHLEQDFPDDCPLEDAEP
jgi:hypothetical protein